MSSIQNDGVKKVVGGSKCGWKEGLFVHSYMINLPGNV